MSAGTKEHDAKAWLFCGCLIFLSGCGTSVTVATRLDPNHSMWSRLDGPSYAIVAEDQRVEATLAFRAYASIVEQALSSVRPGLERKGSASEAGLVLTLVYDAADLGSAVASYPVYGYQYGYFYGCPSGFYRTYGYIGTETYTYHLGYRHSLILSAWVQEANAPAGRHVIWEGRADMVNRDRFLDRAMPYLAAALVRFYGQATEGPIRVRLQDDDPLVAALRGRLRAGPTGLGHSLPATGPAAPHGRGPQPNR